MHIRTFEITLNSEPVQVREFQLGKQQVFHVLLSRSKPISLTLAKGTDKNLFWTSIPQGRQGEAEEIGRVLDEFLSK